MARQIFNDLSGSMNQHVSPSLIPTNQWSLLVNCSQEYLGALTNRDGAELLDQINASNPVLGLGAFEDDTGARFLHAFHARDLYVFDESGGSFGVQQSDIIAADATAEFANYIGRNYFIGSDSTDYLRYATDTGNSILVKLVDTTASTSSTGSTLVASSSVFTSGMVGFTVFNTTDGTSRTITAYTSPTTVTVDTAINDTWDSDAIEVRMPGKFLAVSGPYLIVAGGSRKAYWSQIEDDEFDVVTDWAATAREHTGVAAMGNGRAFLLFTRSSYMVVDPNSGDTEEVIGFGCVSHRSIAVVRGRPIWLSDNGFNMLVADISYPEDISKLIRNDATLQGIMNKITTGNLTVTAAGAYRERYLCAVRDLSGTIDGLDLDDVILEFNVETLSWKAHTYTRGGLATVFASFIDENGEEGLYAGSIDDGSVYKVLNTTVSQDDNGSGVAADFTSYAITPHRVFGQAESVENGRYKDFYFKYKAEDAVNVDISIDGGTFTDLVTLPAQNTNDFYWEYKASDKMQGKSVRLKFTFTGAFTLFEWGIDVEKQGNTNQKSI